MYSSSGEVAEKMITLNEVNEIKTQLEKINWNIDYGTVKIQIRQGKATLITVEATIKLD